MKTIYNIMYLLLFVGIFTGCVADNDFIDCGATSSKDESQQTQVMLSLAVPVSQRPVASRSVSIKDDSQINNFVLWAFDGEGDNARFLYGIKDTDKDEKGNSIIKILESNGTKKMYVMLPESKSKITLVMITNSSVATPNVGKVKSEALSSINYSIDDPNNIEYMPMYGESTPMTIEEGTKGSIQLRRAMAKVEIDEGSGFCFGVVTAINKAEEELAKGGTLYCLGDIVHNSREVERLKAMGLITINHEEFNHLHDAKVLLRAHGEPPETYITAKRNNIEIIDATCPVVLRLQKKIKQEYTQEDNEEKQIVIYGKNGHAEVLGLVGQTTGKAIVIEKLEEAKSLNFNKSIRLYSQTTKSLDEFQKIVEYIKEHISPDVTFEYYDTICRQVANRIPHIRKFAASHDLVFFVSGKKSSNGKILFNECRKVNPNSHLIDSAEEIDNQLLIGAESIGICGATSTPKWLMEEISKAIKSRI